MKSKEEFNAYNEKEIKPIIAALEAKRLGIADRFSYKKYWRNLKWMALIAVGLAISIEIFPIVPEQLRGAIPITFIYAILAPLYIFIRRNWSFDPINEELKKSVIPKIISFLNPQLTYKPEEGISLREFNQSDLFETPRGFQSKDLVEGTIDDIPLRLSNVQMSRKENRRTGQESSTSHSLIQGLYAVMKLNRTLPSRVIIRQKNVVGDAIHQFAQQILGEPIIKKLGDQMHISSIKAGHEDFDKSFEVACTDEEAAKQVLNLHLLKLLLALKSEGGSQEPGLQILISVFDDQLHIVYQGVNIFDGDAHRSFIENDISNKYFLYLSSVSGMAKAIQSTS